MEINSDLFSKYNLPKANLSVDVDKNKNIKNEQTRMNYLIRETLDNSIAHAKCYKHFFDGHACIHKFKIERGTNKVFYSNRMLKTKAYTRSLAEQRLYPVFGTVDLCSNVFGRLKTVFNFHETMDNVNVNVVPFGKILVF